MPGTGTVNGANQVFTPLVLSVTEDTYTFTAGREFSMAAPLRLRLSADTNNILIAFVAGGPFFFQPSSWTNDFTFTLKSGQTLVLYVKATTGTPSLYIASVADAE
jgi:hypothetical protein